MKRNAGWEDVMKSANAAGVIAIALAGLPAVGLAQIAFPEQGKPPAEGYFEMSALNPDTHGYPRLWSRCGLGGRSSRYTVSIENAYNLEQVDKLFPSLAPGDYPVDLTFSTDNGLPTEIPERWRLNDDGRDERIRNPFPIALLFALAEGHAAGAEYLSVRFDIPDGPTVTRRFYIGDMDLCLVARTCALLPFFKSSCSLGEEGAMILHDLKSVVDKYEREDE